MIIVNIARITPDNLYLEFNVETNSNYKFKNLYMWKSSDIDIWVPNTETVDLSDFLDKVNNKEIKRIPLSDISIDTDLIYYLQFIIEWNNTGIETEDVNYSNIAVVNLSSIYDKKLELIKIINNTQSVDRDILFKIFIIENCLKLALSLERYEDANFYCANLKKLII